MALDKNKSYQDIAAKILDQMKEGTAPWMKPWDVAPSNPYNATTGAAYKGINAISLHCEGREDPRWMTYKQAQANDMQVRKGEKGSPIVYWQMNKESTKTNSSGEKVKIVEKLERPRLFRATVFNAEQIDGIEPLEIKPNIEQFETIERAENMLIASGAKIDHGGDRAFYSKREDRIQLPNKEDFKTEGHYYSTALHELGHWTGAEDRLDRDLSGAFGSAEYAKEELRAEIYSYMLSSELQIPHDPSEHVAYIEHWINKLEDDPTELYRASKSASDIKEYTMTFDRSLDIEQTKSEDIAAEAQAVVERSKGKAKAIKPDLTLADKITPIDLAEDLRKACQDIGLVMDKPPVLDGKWHRVAVEGGSKNKKDGTYRAFDDGVPAGTIINHKSGDKTNWKATLTVPLTPEKRAEISETAKQNSVSKSEKTDATHKHKANLATRLLEAMPIATDDNSYLKSKNISSGSDLHEDKKGRLVVPVNDVKGNVQSIVRINSTGSFKSNMKGAKIKGGMYVVGGDLKDAKDIIIAEGFSTGKTLHEATGLPVVVAFSSNNLASVTASIKREHGSASLMVCGDDDRFNDKNVGRAKATDAAKIAGTSPVFPEFPENSKGTDFNDLAKETSASEVKKQVVKGFNLQREKERSISLAD